MKRMIRVARPLFLAVAAGLLALAVMGPGNFTCGNGDKEGTITGEMENPLKEGRGALNPDGTYSLRCNHLLGNYTEGPGGYRFVAGGSLKNTGNVGIVTEVNARWELLGSGPATTTERVRLDTGEQRRVQMTLPATQDEIDAHRSAGEHCKTRVKILDTFGKPDKSRDGQ
jgi:hypothetical protein